MAFKVVYSSNGSTVGDGMRITKVSENGSKFEIWTGSKFSEIKLAQEDVEPTPVEPTPVEPTPVEPTPVEPTPVEPTPVDPIVVAPGGLSFGLSGLNDYSTALPFIDIARTMRPWFGFKSGEWSSRSNQELETAGVLDEQGYPKFIPSDLAGIKTVWAWGGFPSSYVDGKYTLTYNGEGVVKLSGPKIILSEPGKIVFEVNGGLGNWWLDITATTDGNHVRNISIVHERFQENFDRGEVFNPDWINLIKGVKQIRFMDWMETNNSNVVEFDEYPTIDYHTWAHMPPLELMVKLANEIGSEPWFCMPHKASDDLVKKFATYVRDNLRADLRAHVEYSNEAWNSAFKQFHWMHEQARSEWGDNYYFQWYAKRSTQIMKIWTDVFGGTDRLVRHLGTQTVNSWLTNNILKATDWEKKEPNTYLPPREWHDSIAATTYFGGKVVSNSDLRAQLIQNIEDPTIDASAWLYGLLSAVGEDEEFNIDRIKEYLMAQKQVADQYGLKLYCYEGGQHVHHSFAVNGLTEEEINKMNNFLADFVRSEYMADLYKQMWNAWFEVSDMPFMHFVECGQPSKWGSWGLISNLVDTNPRAEFLLSMKNS